MSDEKIRAQKTRATETKGGSDSDAARMGGVQSQSRRTGDVSQRADRPDWIGLCKVGQRVSGKIIDAAIEQEEARVTEARECLDWYNRDLERHRANLDRLRLLKQENERAIAGFDSLERENAPGAIDMDADLTGGGEETIPQS